MIAKEGGEVHDHALVIQASICSFCTYPVRRRPSPGALRPTRQIDSERVRRPEVGRWGLELSNRQVRQMLSLYSVERGLLRPGATASK